ncbi:protein-export membrane protein SecF [Candidatus Jorgensenbacteria bacterium RIFCSPLOWO2_12_FULL_42_11]|uniref:Protein-export membrane protein SecF n=1 Tax=Candidatus Jorgensenbacteria bacterium RIFCSPLOWO2_12_FULL_42_11 TaxID=1798473 RepID=A0A1F6C1Q9_9BACT|nr:MAG: protein-export membrane protein SecF [Candidatus Jorgensenbacteria bacterium RIFCSPLOWO2_12_FULL_42_11]
MNIIKHRNIFFMFSGVLILASIFAFFFFGVRQGIDLAGGTNWQIQIKNPAVKDSDLKSVLGIISGYSDLTVKSLSDRDFIIRFSSISEENHQKYYQVLKEKFGEVEERSFESIGPTIGRELRQRFIWAFVLGLLGILFYVAWAFRKVSYPIKSWKYGVIVILCAFHDIIIPIGLMTFLGWRQGVEINTNFIVALMFILGYSINDTIIIFDRVRENLSLANRGHFDFAGLINAAVRQTFSRSINTSLTTVLAISPLYFVGPLSLKYFILTLILGIIVGAYSSIFFASPLLYVWHRKK